MTSHDKTSALNDLLWLYRQKPILTLHFLGALIALFSPIDILSRVPALNDIVGTIGSLFPLVENFAKYSRFPEVTQLYGATMIVTAPYWILVWLRGSFFEMNVNRMLAKLHDSKRSIFFLLALPVLMVPALYVSIFLAEPTEFSLLPFHSARWALAIVGPILYCWLPAFGLLAILLPIRALIKYSTDKI